MQPAPKVFLSYSHCDKRVARRLNRCLTAYGFNVWIDECELRNGAELSTTIRSKIEVADMLLVIASQASAKPTSWVARELDFAREHAKTVIPFFIEPLRNHERFEDYLGVDAMSPQSFADVVHRLMRDLYREFNHELPPASPALLTAGLRELAREEPDIAPLISGCLDFEGLHLENMDTVYNAPFHSLDEALDALFDLKSNETIANHAAYGFCLAGAGTRALSLWISSTGDGGLTLVTAVGSKRLGPALIPAAIKLLSACNPPNNHALYKFIQHNAAQLSEAHRRSVIRLVTWPVRADTDQQGDLLGWVAYKHFPEAIEIQQMWTRWIHAGAFDGKPNSPSDLAHYLTKAHKEELRGKERINEALRSHVRGYLRSRDEKKVFVAMDHVQATAEVDTPGVDNPVLALLLREVEGVSGTAEWNDWRANDPDTAEWMGWYVFEIAKEATGERDWLRALDSTKRMVAFEELRRRILTKDKQEPKE